MNVYKNLDIDDLDGEIWKVITDFPDYSISNLGRVKSFKRYEEGRILRQRIFRDKHLYIRLYIDGKKKPKLVHHLQYETFVKKLEKDHIVHHIDFNPENNRIDNLESMTISEHRKIHMIGKNNPNFEKYLSEEHRNRISKTKKEKYENGETKKLNGINNPNYKYSNQKIIEIKNNIEKGDLTQRKIAEKHGVSRSTVSLINLGKLRK